MNNAQRMEVTDRQEQIARMRYVDGNAIQQIADSLRLSEKAVEKELKRIRVLIDKTDTLTKSDQFHCDTATEEEMRARCRRLGKNSEYTDFCVAAFVHKIPRKQLAVLFVHEEATVKKYKQRRRKELEAV